MFTEGTIGMQSDNKHGRNNVIATVINHGHLVLETTDVAFKGLSWLHLGEEVVAILLKLLQ